MRTWLLVVAGCAPPKLATSPANTSDSSELTMETEVIEVALDPDEAPQGIEVRERVITQARAAGILREETGEPSVVLDKSSIRAGIRAHLTSIQICYERQLIEQPGLTGTTIVEFTIDASGKVAAASASGFQPTIDTCIAAVIKQIAFPKPSTRRLGVKYPFTFKPS